MTAQTLRRTRPRNRRSMILRAAADLFAEAGYHGVSTEDIARAVDIGASALYRHVKNKSDLLEAALLAEFGSVWEELERSAPSDLDAAIDVLAEVFSRRRQMGVLWSREIRHLDDAARRRVRAPFFSMYGELLRLLAQRGDSADPELVVISVIAVLTSQAHHRTPMPAQNVSALLASLARAVALAPLVTSDLPAEAPHPGLAPVSRAQVIMGAATHLFSVRGYQSVTMHDIGQAVGATSASLYKHFATKGDLLTAIVTRATTALQVGLTKALAANLDPRSALSAIVADYVEFATHHVDLLGVLVTEMPNIPEPARHGMRRDETAYVNEWNTLLQRSRPDLDRADVQFRVQAALTIINDAVRTSRLREHPRLTSNLRGLAERALWS